MASSRRWTPGRIFGVIVALSVVGVWGYVMFLTFTEGRAEPRDRMSDVAYRERAEATCAPFAEAVTDLPLASEMDTPEERADVLDIATEEMRAMVAALEALDPPSVPEEATAVERWIDDWWTYLDDRDAYSERFRDGLDEAFRVTDVGGQQIDTSIDDFAHVNYMESCETPDDVG